MKKFFLILILLILQVACTSKEVDSISERDQRILENPSAYDYIIEEQTPNIRPNWTYNVSDLKGEYEKYELFVGISTFAQDEYNATKLAESDALNQISTFIGVYIETELKIDSYRGTGTRGDDFSVNLEEISKQVAENFARNLKILEKYVEKGRYYDPRGFWRPYTKVILLYGIEKNALDRL